MKEQINTIFYTFTDYIVKKKTKEIVGLRDKQREREREMTTPALGKEFNKC